MIVALTSLDEMALRLLDEVEAGTEVQLDITARDAATGSLLMLVMALHEAAQRRRVGVLIDQVSADTIRLSVSGDT